MTITVKDVVPDPIVLIADGDQDLVSTKEVVVSEVPTSCVVLDYDRDDGRQLQDQNGLPLHERLLHRSNRPNNVGPYVRELFRRVWVLELHHVNDELFKERVMLRVVDPDDV